METIPLEPSGRPAAGRTPQKAESELAGGPSSANQPPADVSVTDLSSAEIPEKKAQTDKPLLAHSDEATFPSFQASAGPSGEHHAKPGSTKAHTTPLSRKRSNELMIKPESIRPLPADQDITLLKPQPAPEPQQGYNIDVLPQDVLRPTPAETSRMDKKFQLGVLQMREKLALDALRDVERNLATHINLRDRNLMLLESLETNIKREKEALAQKEAEKQAAQIVEEGLVRRLEEHKRLALHLAHEHAECEVRLLSEQQMEAELKKRVEAHKIGIEHAKATKQSRELTARDIKLQVQILQHELSASKLLDIEPPELLQPRFASAVQVPTGSDESKEIVYTSTILPEESAPSFEELERTAEMYRLKAATGTPIRGSERESSPSITTSSTGHSTLFTTLGGGAKHSAKTAITPQQQQAQASSSASGHAPGQHAPPHAPPQPPPAAHPKHPEQLPQGVQPASIKIHMKNQLPTQREAKKMHPVLPRAMPEPKQPEAAPSQPSSQATKAAINVGIPIGQGQAKAQKKN